MKADLLGRRGPNPKGWVESYFMKANAPDGTRALWTRCTIFAQPGMPTVAESWAIAFDRHRGHLAVKTTVPYEAARFAKDDFDAEVDGCRLSLAGARGALSSGRGALAWDLRFGPSLVEPVATPIPGLVSPIADGRANGAIRIERTASGRDGDVDVWDVTDWPMMAGHNWGRAHPEVYAWTHANMWEIDKKPVTGLVFESISVRVRVGPVLSPMATMMFVRWQGRSWNLTSPRALAHNRATLSLRRWEVTSTAQGLDLACDVAAETDDLLGLHYPNPTGPMTYCLNTKLARARLDLTLPDGETITAISRGAALEIGTLDPDHGIRMVL